jgi:hypothetical protein
MFTVLMDDKLHIASFVIKSVPQYYFGCDCYNYYLWSFTCFSIYQDVLHGVSIFLTFSRNYLAILFLILKSFLPKRILTKSFPISLLIIFDLNIICAIQLLLISTLLTLKFWFNTTFHNLRFSSHILLLCFSITKVILHIKLIYSYIKFEIYHPQQVPFKIDSLC